MAEYTEIKYVDVNGSNTTGDGTEGKPFATIEYCITKLTTVTPLIYLKEGIHTITCLSYISSYGKVITIIGNGIKTVIEVSAGGSSSSGDKWRGNTNFYNCIIRPKDTFSADIRVLSYTDDNVGINYYNVCFTKSLNGIYPTSAFFYLTTSGTTHKNKFFYNCSFIGNAPVLAGSATYNYCAMQSSTTNGTLNNTLVNCLFNSDYQLVNSNGTSIAANTQYGVYSGEKAWVLLECLLFHNKTYYTLDTERNPIEITDTFDDTIIHQKKFPSNLIDFTKLSNINPFKIIIVGNKDLTNLNIKALKSSKELIVAKDNILTSVASNIDCFNLLTSSSGAGTIKLALSIDSGTTWKTWNVETSNFEDLVCTIPNVSYANMTESELIDWNKAKDIIFDNGINIDTFNSLDFNLLNSKAIRFAYVLSRPAYEDKAETSELKWQFDAKGNLQKMTDNECIISVYDQQVKVKSLIDNPIVKVNLMV